MQDISELHGQDGIADILNMQQYLAVIESA